MFRGITTVSLDAKGRMSIPAKYRDALMKLIIVPNPVKDEKCLLVYPIDAWEKVEAEIASKPNTASVRSLKRFFLGQAVEYITDKNGRVLLTPNLRDFAELDKKMILVGQGNKFELWDETVWNSLKDSFLEEATSSELAEELETLVF